MQSFRSRNAIYRRGAGSTLHDPEDYASYEGVLEPRARGLVRPRLEDDPRWQKRWGGTERVELRLTPTRMVLAPPRGREKPVVRPEGIIRSRFGPSDPSLRPGFLLA